ncbi:6-bladed beta-propeller [Gracilimonas sp. Q87]|uniref:6-bladed beta-propeller n=1 Tax=Gracilimonas sp. Q87 TaxID=3384766 RepID=UPI00398414A3
MTRLDKNMKFIFLPVVFFSLAMGCSTGDSEIETNEVDIVKIDSVVLQQGQEIFGNFFEQIKITGDKEYFLFSDRIRNQVFVFNSDGTFHSVIGVNGRGPKGILSVSGYDVNKKNEVFIYDSMQRMLKVFDLNGNLLHSTDFLERETFNPTANNLRWYNNKIVATIYETDVRFETHKSRLVGLIDTSGIAESIFGRFDEYSQDDNNLAFNTVIALDEETDLAYTNLQTSPYFQIYDLKKKVLIGREGQKTDNFFIPERELTPSMPISEKFKHRANTSAVAHIFVTDSYIIQNMQNLTEEWFDTMDYSSKDNFLVIYDKSSLELIQEVSVPSTPFGAHDNQLYFIEDFNPDNYTIGIYEIVAVK